MLSSGRLAPINIVRCFVVNFFTMMGVIQIPEHNGTPERAGLSKNSLTTSSWKTDPTAICSRRLTRVDYE